MDIRSLAIEDIIAVDPRRSMDRTLGQLLDGTAASGGGLFVIREAGPTLVAGRGVDQLAVDRTCSAWDEDALGLIAGRPILAERWCVWPLGGRITALVYLTAADRLEADRVRDAILGLGDLLVIALERAAFPGHAAAAALIDSYLETTPRADIERRQLLALLAANEWNISRVSRVLGVTRKTIYNRIERLGIERIRVLKALT